jgi:hypothetical protein
MKTLQEFIENKFVEKYKSKERVKIIDINEHLNRVFKEIANKEIEGGKLDLSDYPNLERLRVNSDCLKNSLTELLLNNNPNLKTLVITNSPNLTSINISGCSNLNIMNVNGMELIEACRSLEVKG